MAEQRREYYRVHYPMSDRPVLLAKADRYEVMDVSEFGVCFKQDERYIFKPGMLLEATICFSDGNTYVCTGEVLRCEGARVCVQLHTPIPMQRIRAESVYLSMTYSARCAE
jgi:hypothetical protein